MDLTKEEKKILIEILSQLTFTVNLLDRATLIKGIIEKFQTKEEIAS